MSYILDALRRADAERQRGAVPGLHAQPLPAPAASESASRRTVPLLWALTGGGLLLAVVAAAIWSTGQGRVPALAQAPAAARALAFQRAEAPNPSSGGRSLPPTAGALPSPPDAATAPPAISPPLSAPPAAPRLGQAAKVGPAAPPSPATAPASPAGKTGARAPALGSGPTAVAASRAAPAPAVAPVPRLADLPDALRRQLPPLSLGGSVYSEQAERRIAIVNGQVAHEGDEPAAGLRVRRIGLRSVVFEFRGQAFEVGL